MRNRWPPLTDELLRQALTVQPDEGLVQLALEELSAAIDQAPQRRRTMEWPWSQAWPATGPTIPRRLAVVPMVIIAASLIALAIALAALVGSMLRSPTPFAPAGLIAFDSDGDIFVADPDGTGRWRLTTGDGTDVQPTFSPDGRRLAYESLDPVTQTVRLIIVQVDGSPPTVVATIPAVARASGPTIGWLHVAWSPDGNRLLYTAPVGGTQQTFVVDADGADGHQIGDPALEGHDATWSPDGRLIAFVGGHFDQDHGIFVMGADGSGAHRVDSAPSEQWAFDFSPPVWSPTGAQLAFSARVDVASHVYVVDLDGGARRQLGGSGTVDDWGAAWSPDGDRLAWHRGRVAASGSFVVAEAAGGPETVLAPAVVGPPTWSPDGTRLIGYRIDPNTGGRSGLVIVNMANGTVIDLVAASVGDASWQARGP